MTHRIHTLLTLLLLTLTCQITQAADLPNILWITSEDNGKELGCYGDKYSVTPNIDGLAAKGFRYTNCSSTAPVCAPARTTIISGVYPPATGGQHMRSHVPMPAEFKMYPQFLRDAGYFCTNKDYKVNGESDRLVGFIDLAPTLLSIIGVEPPEWMQGNAFAGKFQTGEPKYSHGFRDRMDERIDCVRQTRSKKYSYLKNYLPHKQWGQYIRFMFVMPTTQVWHDMFHKGELNEVQSQFWKTKPAEELYDLENDPHETNNLANDPAHADALAEMRAAHAEWSSRVKDIGLLPESVSNQLRAISPKPNNPPNRAGDYSIALKNKTLADLRRRK